MQIDFIRTPPEDLARIAEVLADPAFRAAINGVPAPLPGPANAAPPAGTPAAQATDAVAGLRAGAAAAVAHAAVRRPPPEVRITATELAGRPAERLQPAGALPGGAGRCLLYLHGGAFSRGSLDLGRANAAELARASGLTVWALGYRQAPEHPYPAAPEDVHAAWQALLAAGHAPGQMVVVGESSGGCLALGLVADLQARGQALPAGVAALSPLTDLALGGPSWHYNGHQDLAALAMAHRVIDLYCPPGRRGEPLASPLRHHWHGACPLWLAIGSIETMLSDTEALARRADEAGTDVTLAVYEGLPHGFPRFALPSCDRALAQAAAWCRGRLGLAV